MDRERAYIQDQQHIFQNCSDVISSLDSIDKNYLPQMLDLKRKQEI